MVVHPLQVLDTRSAIHKGDLWLETRQCGQVQRTQSFGLRRPRPKAAILWAPDLILREAEASHSSSDSGLFGFLCAPEIPLAEGKHVDTFRALRALAHG